MKWWPIIIHDPATSILIASELHTKKQEKALLQDRIDIVSAYPPARIVFISGGGSMTQADWLAEASTEMAIIDEHIAALESNQ